MNYKMWVTGFGGPHLPSAAVSVLILIAVLILALILVLVLILVIHAYSSQNVLTA